MMGSVVVPRRGWPCGFVLVGELMSGYRFALAYNALGGPLREAVTTAALAGARGLHFNARDDLQPLDLTGTSLRQFLHVLAEKDLVVASLSFPTRRPLYDEDRLDARVTAAKQAIELTRRLKASLLTLRVGRLPAADSKEEATLREVLEDLARHGNLHGVIPCLTPGGDGFERLTTLARSIATGMVGIDFDPGALAVAGRKPHELYRDCHDIVPHITARDAVRDLDAEGGALEVPIGRGEVDWVELLPLLHEAAFQGWVTVNRTQGTDRAGDVTRGVQYLTRVLFE